jgi:hypothetical protein
VALASQVLLVLPRRLQLQLRKHRDTSGLGEGPEGPATHS